VDSGFGRFMIASQWLDLTLIMFEDAMATPAEISKLTAHADRARHLMEDAAAINEHAGPILDEFEDATLAFRSHLLNVKTDTAELKAVIAAMGNAAPAIKSAAQPQPKDGKAAVEAKPSETAGVQKTT
jgi:hypothetical protein